MDHDTSKPDKAPLSRKNKLLISLAILLTGAIILTLIFTTEPTAQREGAAKKTAMLVEVIPVEKGHYHPAIKATGTVIAAQDIMLSPRVSGEIIHQTPVFTPGGFVQKGQTLLQIDPADYKNTLLQRESELRQATADLNIEMGRQNVAEQDYALLAEELTPENEALILRKPQLNAARSRVESARAAVNQAKLDLQRTTIKAPFDAHIITRNVTQGSQVGVGENLGRLVGVNEYWIETTIPLKKIRWLAFPENDHDKGSLVKIRNRTAWAKDEYRTGYLYKRIGALEDQTRLARILVTVPDPLSRKANAEEGPALMLNAFVEVNIQAREIKNVYRISKDYIRKDETIWVMEGDELRIRNVDIIVQDATYAYIRKGLHEDDQVVTTNLSTVVDGSKLRVKSDTIETKDTGQVNQ